MSGRALSPLFSTHVNPYGRSEPDMASVLDIALPVVPGSCPAPASAAADAGLREPRGEERLFSRGRRWLRARPDGTVHPVVPPRVEYTLTEPGQALRVTIDGLCDWTHLYLGHIEASRHRFDA